VEKLKTDLPLTAGIAGRTAEATERLATILCSGEVDVSGEVAVQLADRMLALATTTANLEIIVARALNGMEFTSGKADTDKSST